MYAFPIGVPRWPQDSPRWPEVTKLSQNGSQKDGYKMARGPKIESKWYSKWIPNLSTLIFLTGLWTVLGNLMQGATLSLVSSDVHNGNHNSQRWLCVGILKKSHTNGTPFQGPLGFKPPRPPGGGGPAAPRAPCSILERLRLSSSPFS